MDELVKDLSKPHIKGEDGRYTQLGYKLQIGKSRNHKELVAYTFNNGHDKRFHDAFIEALKEFKQLRFVTGVSGRTNNSLQQSSLFLAVKEAFGDKVTADLDSSLEEMVFTLK